MNDRDQSHTRVMEGREDLAGNSTEVVTRILDRFGGRTALSVLEIGCGPGANLAAAGARGWQCFGVEVSDQVRAAAQHQLGEAAYIVKSIPDLFAHKFDLVLMSDVLERYPSPYHPFYELFSLGAIAPDTVVLVTTSDVKAGAAESLVDLLRRLRFTEIDVKSLSSTDLFATASGSDFEAFMHERYVPGTWSRIAAYEHIPRYSLAKTLAAGKAVLDFGCGTGYGAAMLADVAKDVTGLDIDESALAWARQTHGVPNLAFQRHDDLGATLPAASFDLVTCFEMIEHVDHSTQQRTVASIARLLRDDGLLIISTPNPETTKLYGANPYHIREMTEVEFHQLLSPSFPHVRILRQHVRPGVTFGQDADRGIVRAMPLDTAQNEASAPTMAFIALCARQPIPEVPDCAFFDHASDYVGDFIDQDRKTQAARTEAYTQRARAHAVEVQYRIVTAQRDETVVQLNLAHKAKNELEHAKNEIEQAKNHVERQLTATVADLDVLRRIRQDELSSPRFLARQLWHATRTRLRSIIRVRFLGKSD
ncbi:MAG: class I SAM-dependent methyltransferase [Rhodospirillaceae bacterium]|nr:MAG: class I SAM-dependent methyltransferase [Rhodospirillaceae bacterium]